MKEQIFITTAIFIAAMFGGVAHAQTPLMRVNREIAQTRSSIDSVRNAYAGAMAYQMRKNSNYRYIRNNACDIDTLERENERLLDYAIELIHRAHPSAFILRTPVVFIQYRNLSSVASVERMYNNNKRKIREYGRRVAAFRPEYQIIKNRCDSAMHAQIDMYQLRLDSLLNRKLELIR
ncbi:MAG: hypothetical protein NC311_04045 [Muribaculaceae bacterium]|nr:hypothetical protein [Muribaculaceae bacterium]